MQVKEVGSLTIWSKTSMLLSSWRESVNPNQLATSSFLLSFPRAWVSGSLILRTFQYVSKKVAAAASWSLWRSDKTSAEALAMMHHLCTYLWGATFIPDLHRNRRNLQLSRHRTWNDYNRVTFSLNSEANKQKLTFPSFRQLGIYEWAPPRPLWAWPPEACPMP